MSHDIKRGKLPFKLTGSVVNTGYQEYISSSFKPNTDIVNLHIDTYAGFDELPIQSPFTNQHVGGNQHRHVYLNTGSDNDFNRPEAFKINLTASSLRVYGPDFESVDKPRAQYFKGAKSSINISNIKNNKNILGNFKNNYEVIQTSGRRISNNLINDHFTASSNLTTQFINGLPEYSLPEILNNSKSIFVERFSAPGGKQESSRGALDRESEEYSANNTVNSRNIKARQPYYTLLTRHASQFSSSSLDGVSEHKINRNSLKRLQYSGSNVVTSSNYDNFWVQHPIPRSDLNYAWITQSANINQSQISGYQKQDTDIQFSRIFKYELNGNINLNTQTISTSISSSDYSYSTWKQIRGNEHPVSIKLRKNNFIAIQDPIITKKITFNNNTFINVVSKRPETSTLFREPSITTKYKPIEQDFILKSDTESNYGHKMKYTFANNDSAFANKNLNQRLNIVFNDSGLYNKVLDLQNPQIIPPEQNPFNKLLGLTYKETIYPREENTYLSGTRARLSYTLSTPGFSRDGYDVTLGTQRVTWRAEQQDRKRSKRTDGGYLNSLNYSSIQENANNFIHEDNGVLTDGKLVNVNSTFRVTASNINDGVFNSIRTLETGSNERQFYSFRGAVDAENLVEGEYYILEIYNDIIKRGYTYDLSGEWNNFYNDFYEQIKNNTETNKRSIGSLYRNTSFKSYLSVLPTDRNEYVDLSPKTEDEVFLVNPRPKYVSFIGGVEANISNFVQTASNFSNQFSFNKASLNGEVYAVVVSGNDVYVGGNFSSINGNTSGSYIGKWNTVTDSWSYLNNGVDGPVYALLLSGTDLYVGGNFTDIDSLVNTTNVAKWKTTSPSAWSSLGTSLNGVVKAFALNNNDLYIGGNFTNANSIPDADLIVRYVTSPVSWNVVGTDNLSSSNSIINTIVISGSDIYVGGAFTGSNITGSPNIAKNSGAAWLPLGNDSINSVVRAMILSGTDLYVGGDFTQVSGILEANYLAKWETLTDSWNSASYEYPAGSINCLFLSASDIYVGGNYSYINNEYATSSYPIGYVPDFTGVGYIAKLNTSTYINWYPLGYGTNKAVNAIAISGNNALYVGGSFTQAGETKYSTYISEWRYSESNWYNLLEDISENIFADDYFDQIFNINNFSFSTLDNGLQKEYSSYTTDNSTYDSYEAYCDEIKRLAKDYSIIPEFRISEHIKYYVSASGGNFRNKNNSIFSLDGIEDSNSYKSSVSELSDYNNDYFKKYLTSDILTKNKKIENDYNKELKLSKLTLTCKGIKKLLPYNGFYPQERTVQLANLYSEYIDNNLHGGVYNLYNFNDYNNKNVINNTNLTASSISVAKAFNKYYMAVGNPTGNLNISGSVRIYSTYDEQEDNWNSSSYVVIDSTSAGTNILRNFGQNVKLISASNGLNLFISTTYSGSNSSGFIYHSTSSNGTNWSIAQRIASGPGSNSKFGLYYDALYDTINGREKLIIAVGAPNHTVTYSNRGVLCVFTGSLDLNSKQWSWTPVDYLQYGSSTNNKLGTGVSLVSCSSGYQLFYGSPGEGNGLIKVVTSTNAGLSWSAPVASIVSGTTSNSGIATNNIKAINYNNRNYVFYSEPYLTIGANANAGAVYVVSSSNAYTWTINSQKTALLSGSTANDYILNSLNSYSIEAGTGGGKLFYAFANSNKSGVSIPAKIHLGDTSDGLTWKANNELLTIVDTFGANTITSTKHTVNSAELPVFFTALQNPEKIRVLKNNVLTQYSVKVSGMEKYFKQAALEPLMSPGILYNTIKSGIAVDWPCATGSQTSIQPYGTKTIVNAYYPKTFKMFEYNGPAVYQSAYGLLRSNIDYRIPFENLLFPDEAFEPKDFLEEDLLATTYLTVLSNNDPIPQFLDKCYIYGGYEPYISPYDFGDINNLGPKKYSVPFVYRKKNGKNNGLYTLAMSNFLAETVKFFLRDEKLVTFTSLPDYKWKRFQSGKTYYMDVVLEKSSDLTMMEAYHSALHPTGTYGEKMHGRYFGYPVNKTNKDIWTNNFTPEESKLIHNDPAYAPYTPPYFEGTARARLSFTPPSGSKSYNLQEILDSIVIEDIHVDVARSAHIDSDAYIHKMAIDSSIELFGEAQSVNTTITTGMSSRQIAENLDSKLWIISPKMETPVLDFSNQQLRSYSNNYSKTSGFGRGMWSGDGTVPTDGKGIKIRLEYPYARTNISRTSKTGSLLEQVGFKAEEKFVGKLADNKLISEAVIAIPYLENETSQTVKTSSGFNFISIDKEMYNLQKINLDNGESAIKANQLRGITQDISTTSISDMINKMKKYVIPPEFNFLQYSDIQPFCMYIFEFEHILSQNDLANIWQGKMPQISYNAEEDEIKIEHKIEKYEFFGGNSIPENIKWLIFRVKRRAEINYFNVTATSKDDARFSFNKIIGRSEGTDVYSYNWPYDYFSLVELAKLEVAVDYEDEEEEIDGEIVDDVSIQRRARQRRKRTTNQQTRASRSTNNNQR